MVKTGLSYTQVDQLTNTQPNAPGQGDFHTKLSPLNEVLHTEQYDNHNPYINYRWYIQSKNGTLSPGTLR